VLPLARIPATLQSLAAQIASARDGARVVSTLRGE